VSVDKPWFMDMAFLLIERAGRTRQPLRGEVPRQGFGRMDRPRRGLPLCPIRRGLGVTESAVTTVKTAFPETRTVRALEKGAGIEIPVTLEVESGDGGQTPHLARAIETIAARLELLLLAQEVRIVLGQLHFLRQIGAEIVLRVGHLSDLR
jgi:hypothetical protein